MRMHHHFFRMTSILLFRINYRNKVQSNKFGPLILWALFSPLIYIRSLIVKPDMHDDNYFRSYVEAYLNFCPIIILY